MIGAPTPETTTTGYALGSVVNLFLFSIFPELKRKMLTLAPDCLSLFTLF